MKKHLLIAGLICVATIPPAMAAVTKCVALTPSTTCLGSSVNGATWSATCSGGRVSLQGVAFCSDQDGQETGAKTTNLTYSHTTYENMYCWCKMISPAVSQWVHVSINPTPTSSSNCTINCRDYCASRIMDSADFRSAIFSNLI